MMEEVSAGVSIIAVVVGAAWTVAQIKSATALLRQSIEHLTEKIADLSHQGNDHDKRLRRIELKQAKDSGRDVMTES